MDGFPSDGFVTTTILARLMPFGAPSTPSAKGRFDPFTKPSANGRYLRIADGRSRRLSHMRIAIADVTRPARGGAKAGMGLSVSLRLLRRRCRKTAA
jgi:hypothetical protein